jgi:methyl-accepting chemotaxis protein
MGIDPATTDHVIDAVDQQIEHAAERVEQIVETIRDAPLPPTEHAALVERLQGVTENIEQAVDRVDSIVAAADTAAPSETVALPLDELSEATAQVGEAVERVETVIAVTADAAAPIVAEERDAIVAGLDDAAKQIKDAVDDVDEMVAEAREKRRV